MKVPELWVEKYRPATFDDYVWSNPEQRQKAEEWVASKSIPSLLLVGKAGTGKTSLAHLLLSAAGIGKGDILFIKASKHRKIEEVEEKLDIFTNTWALNETGLKYVIMDEADSLSALSQRFLRSEMEEEHVRYILTCNYPERISTAIHSRLPSMYFSAIDKDEYVVRCGEVLVKEGIEFELDVMMEYVNKFYPDLRKCIGMLQQGCLAGALKSLPTDAVEDDQRDYLIEALGMFKSGDKVAARELIVAKAEVEEYVDLYQWFYSNLDLWGDQKNQDKALLIIRNALVYHATIADPEINLAAMLVELCNL